MNTIVNAALDRSRTVLTLLAFILLAGFYAYLIIPKESTPDVKIPILYVSLHHNGIAPEDAERLLVRPLEQKLHGIEGIKEMKSGAYENGGFVMLEFHAGLDLNKAKSDVRDKVDEAKALFPTNTDEPVINEVNLSLFPVLIVNLSGSLPFRTLHKLANELQDEIEAQVAPILRVDIRGERDNLLEIIIDPIKLEGYGFQLEDVITKIKGNNQLISAGILDTGKGRLSIKVPGLLSDLEAFLDLPLKAEGDAVVKLRDVASIRKTFKDPDGYARDRGVPCVSLEIVKRTGENIIETISAVRKVVEQQRKNWPKQVKVTYAQDESDQIKDRLHELQNSLILAVILVMAVIIYSLGLRAAFLVTLAVPGSFLLGILILNLLGLTVNIVVLFSLILVVGMLVDGAIIVVEFAERKAQEGYNQIEAFRIAASRMFWPVVTSISTILVVFLPLLFWPGVVGQFMKFLPITLIATLTASILMALIFVPVVGSIIGLKVDPGHQKIDELHLNKSDKLAMWYVGILERALEQPKKVLLSAVGVLIAVFVTYLIFGKGVEFFPDIEPDSIIVQVHARGNLSVDEKDHLVKQVENKIIDMTEFQSVFTNTDLDNGTQNNGMELLDDVVGTITLEFVDWKKRRRATAIIADIQQRTKNIPGIYVEVTKEKAGPPSSKPIEIELSAMNYGQLEKATKKLRTYADAVPGLTAIEDTLPIPGIDWQIIVDRAQAAKFGTDIAKVGNAISIVTAGLKVDEFRPDYSKDEVDVVVRFPENQRNLNELENLKIMTSKGLVPISMFVKSQPVPKRSKINRTDGKRVFYVKADIKPGVLADDKVAEIKKWLDSGNLGDDIKYQFKGDDADQKETGAFLFKAFAVAIFLIIIILITQFNSFFSMGLVMSSVLMSTIGVFVGMLVMGQTFSIVMSGLGVIALAGIIVSNNIILIDTYDHLATKVKDLKQAIILTGAQRLRPVLLTKVTIILGLLPIMFGVDVDILGLSITQGAPSTQWWIQLSTAIVFGVLFASVLTLIVTPCALMLRANKLLARHKQRKEIG